MKILLFCEEFGNDFTTFIYNEAIELQKRNHEVLFLCCKRTNDHKYDFENLVVLPFERNLLERRVHYFLEKHDILMSYSNNGFSKKLNSIINQFQPDIIHCHFGSEALKILDNLKNNDIPVFITFHGYDASFKLAWVSYIKALRKHLAKPNVYAIFVNNFFKKLFEKKSIPVHQSMVIHCGIDAKSFMRKSTSLKRDPFVFLQVAGFFDKKGHSYTVKAFDLMLKQHPDINAKLILAGDGPTFSEVQQLVKTLGLERRIEFTGLVNKNRAIELMENAHFFVHHSITPWDNDAEGIPTAIMEAMAMQLPIISTWHSGLPELVQDGVSGFLVNEKDVETYAQKMWEITKWNYLPNNQLIIEQKFELQLYIQNLEKEFSLKAHINSNDIVKEYL